MKKIVFTATNSVNIFCFSSSFKVSKERLRGLHNSVYSDFPRNQETPNTKNNYWNTIFQQRARHHKVGPYCLFSGIRNSCWNTFATVQTKTIVKTVLQQWDRSYCWLTTINSDLSL